MKPDVMAFWIWNGNGIELGKVPRSYLGRNMQSGMCLRRPLKRRDHDVLNFASQLSLLVSEKTCKTLPVRATGADDGLRRDLKLDNEL